ncbi:MAG: carboxymuconolactone decarboxylase family protein [Chloroflexi bacterium]|nr:carboxymuconolactone decarboxylase family protein [Chloroflexota bacterium]MDA1145599.1 carboxymuconolactone decarboxylase family protein [Chloroflexota bacterium]
MARLPNLLNRAEVPAELVDAYDRVAALRNGAVSGPYGILLHSPELAERVAALGEFVRWNSALTPVQSETAIITAARYWNADLMWGAHVRIGREAGIREEVIAAVGTRAALDGLAPGEAAIVQYVRELLETHRVQSATFEALRDAVGERGVVDLTGLVGYYAVVGFTLNGFEVEPPAGSEPLPA